MSETKPTFLDRAVAYLSPQRGLKRYQARMAWNMLPSVRSTAGSARGAISNWTPSFLSRREEGEHRSRALSRAQDVVKNDAHAASVVHSMATNIVGTGLEPQSRPKQDALGWSDEQTLRFQQQAEWVWRRWCKYADARGGMTFAQMQHLTCRSLLTNGEYFRIPLMLRGTRRPLSLALQGVSPLRVLSPAGEEHEKEIRDGIRLDALGRAERYYVYDPPRGTEAPAGDAAQALTSDYFRKFPAWINPFRPGMMHGFIQQEEEQIRGMSVLTPAMKMFKDMSDYLDFELIGTIVASSFPVFVESQQAGDMAEQQSEEAETEDGTRPQEVEPGQIMYGNPGERPHVLSSQKPSSTFGEFTKRMLRAQGASVGMPYEIISKDFSETNYSSARAALLEADKTFRSYRTHLVEGFHQPIYNMVLEEAWLRGILEVPGDVDFYEAYDELTDATWIPPRRGHVDPVKETQADIRGLQWGTKTLAEVIQERGDDWEAHLEQIKREEKKKKSLSLSFGEQKQ